MKQIFEEMYQKKIWGGGSGVGSLPEATVRYRAVLQKLLTDYQVRSVVDIGCGDWQTGSLVDWTGIEYTGIDIVPEVIEADRKRYGRRGRHFLCGNVLEMSPPAADLLIIKDVLQHLGTGGRIPLPAADRPVPAGPRDERHRGSRSAQGNPLDRALAAARSDQATLQPQRRGAPGGYDPPPGSAKSDHALPQHACHFSQAAKGRNGACAVAPACHAGRHEETLVDVVAEATRGRIGLRAIASDHRATGHGVSHCATDRGDR